MEIMIKELRDLAKNQIIPIPFLVWKLNFEVLIPFRLVFRNKLLFQKY